MATPNDQPGAFALEVAGVGREVVKAFTKCITSRMIQERHMETILATLSITTSILTDLGTTINKHAKDVYINDDVTRPTCETCKENLQKILVISKESTESGIWMREGTLGGKPVAAEIDPWFLFNVALGGREQAAEFWAGMETTRYSLVALSDTVKYKIFKELNEQNRLTPEQTKEFKSLTALLPQLVRTIERAEEIKKERREYEAQKAAAEQAEKDRIEAEKARMEAEKARVDAEKALKSSRNRPDVGQKDDLEKPVLERKNSNAASELTMIEPTLEKKRVRILPSIEDDRRSICSLDSMDDSNFLDTKEIFEEWTLRWNPGRKNARKSWGLMGMKIKEYYEDPGFWGIDPEYRSQAELQDAYDDMTANASEIKHRATVNKAMRNLPADARESIEGLIELREKACSNGKFQRQWSVVAVRPKTKYHYGGEGLFKSSKNKDWYIMLKGETVDRKERKLPNRWDDPWRKPYQPLVRSRRRHIDDDYYGGDWPRDRVRRLSPIRRPRSPVYYPPPVHMPAFPMAVMEDNRHRELSRDAEIDGYRPGTIVVGNVPTAGEAEKKMEKILEDLPGKFTL